MPTSRLWQDKTGAKLVLEFDGTHYHLKDPGTQRRIAHARELKSLTDIGFGPYKERKENADLRTTKKNGANAGTKAGTVVHKGQGDKARRVPSRSAAKVGKRSKGKPAGYSSDGL